MCSRIIQIVQYLTILFFLYVLINVIRPFGEFGYNQFLKYLEPKTIVKSISETILDYVDPNGREVVQITMHHVVMSIPVRGRSNMDFGMSTDKLHEYLLLNVARLMKEINGRETLVKVTCMRDDLCFENGGQFLRMVRSLEEGGEESKKEQKN